MNVSQYDAGSVYLQFVPSFRNIQRAVQKEAKNWGQDSGKEYQKGFESAVKKVKSPAPGKAESAKAGDTSAGAFADAFKRRVSRAAKGLPELSVDVDRSQLTEADRDIQKVRDALLRLSNQKVGVDVSSAQAVAEVKRLEERLKSLSLYSSDVQVKADTAAAMIELKEFNDEINKVNGKDINIVAKIREARFADFSNRMQAILSVASAIAPALIPIAAVGAAVFGGLALSASAAVPAILGIGLALSGVVGAFKAMSDAQKTSAYENQQAAKSAASAASAVKSAEESLVQARRRAVKSAQDATKKIAKAKEDQVKAEESASRDIQEALRRVRDSEENLRGAQEDSRKAQDELSDARENAKRKLEDLQSQMRGGILDEKAARLDLADAYDAVALVGESDLASIEDRERANLRLAEAQLKLSDIERNNARLVKDNKAAQAAGISGSDEVVSAQDRIKAANEAVAKAQQDSIDAARSWQDAQKEAAESVRDASQAVTDALVAQQEDQIDSAYAVASAQRSLADATRSTGDIGSASMRSVRQAMDGLSPTAQDFVKYLFGIRGEFGAIQTAAEVGFLPGLKDGIEALRPQLPLIATAMGALAGAAGVVAANIGKALAGPAFTKFFEYLAGPGADQLVTLGDAFIIIAVAVADLMVALSPLSDIFVALITDLATGFADFIKELQDSGALERFLAYAIDHAPEVEKFFLAMGKALLAIAKALITVGPQVLEILTRALEAIAEIPPEVLGLIIAIVTPITLLLSLLTGLSIVLGPIVALFGALGVTWSLIIIGVLAVIGVVTYLYARFESVRTVVDAFGRYIKWSFDVVTKGGIIATLQLWLFQRAFDYFLDFVRRFAPRVFELIREGFDSVKSRASALGEAVRDGLVSAFRSGVDKIKSIWDEIKHAASAPVRFLVDTVLNKGIIGGFNSISQAVGAPQIPTYSLPKNFAGGGVLPGYSPGWDNFKFTSQAGHELNLGGGEAIMRPEFTRGVGASWINRLNMIARTRGSNGVRSELGSFARGGIFNPGDLAREGIDTARGVLAGGTRKFLEKLLSPVLGSLDSLGSNALVGILKAGASKTIQSVLGFTGLKETALTPPGGGFVRDPRGWPSPVAGRVATNTQGMINFARLALGFSGSIGTLGNRPNKSDHPLGKAADFMISDWNKPSGLARGNALAASLIQHAPDFGLKNIIWQKKINKGSGWEPYSHPTGKSNPTLDHMDHVHASLFDDGGLLPPGLTLALNKTSKPERVVTDSTWNRLTGDTMDYDRLASAMAKELRRDPLKAEAYLDGKKVTDQVSKHLSAAFSAGVR